MNDGNIITLDQDAAGIGWFIDPTPEDDSEFNPIENSPGEGKVDLLTAIAHEMGHVLGLSHVDYGTSLMSATLPIGVRRLPTWSDIHFTDEISPKSAELNLDTNSSSIVYWVGGSGYWDDLNNWSTGKLPGATDEVVIDVPQEVIITFREGLTSTIAKLTIQEDLVISGGSLTILGEGAINNDFILNNGTLNTTGTVIVNNDFILNRRILNTTGTVTLKGQNNQWYAGTLSGSGIVNIAAEATLNINNGDYKRLRNKITLNNQGTVNWNADNYYMEADSTSTGEVINNEGIFEIKNNLELYYLTFNNSGTLIKSNSTGTTTFYDSIFNNTGTVDLRQGRVNFRGGGSSNDGTFKLAANTTAEFSTSYTLDVNTIVENEGAIEVSGGNVNLNQETVKSAYMVVRGGTLNLAGTRIDLLNLFISGGTLNTTGTVIVNNDFILNRRILNTTGTVTLKGQNNQWYAGTLSGSGIVNIAAEATLNINNGDYKRLRNKITLNNQGTVNWNADNYYMEADSTSTGEVINNEGIFEIKNNLELYYLTFNNSGTLIKSNSTGTTTFYDSIFNNTGTVDLRQGKLYFYRGKFIKAGGTFDTSNTTFIEDNQLPDLKIIGVELETTIKPGSSIGVSWTVENQGKDITDATTWYDAIYLSVDNIFDVTDTFISRILKPTIPAVLPIYSNYTLAQTITLPKTATGNQYLLFITDEKYYQLEEDGNNNIFAQAIQFLDINNNPPTEVELSNNTIDENSLNGTLIGTLNTIDPDLNETHTYKLLDSASGRFFLDGKQLKVANGGLLDFENQKNYNIIIQSVDKGGLSLDKTFKITINNANEAPFNIQLNNTQIDENSSNNYVIGTFNTLELDEIDTHTYEIVNDANGRFKIVGNELQVANSSLLNFENNTSHTIKVKATDAGGLSFEKTFTIAIKNVNEAPTAIQLSNNSINEHSPNGTVVATFSTIDTDRNDSHTYTLLNNADGRFAITNNRLIVANSALLDFEQNTNHIITIRTQDIGGLTWEQNFDINIINVKEIDLVPTITKFNNAPTTSGTILRATSGDLISLEWDVKNAGADDTSGTWVDRIYLSDAPPERFTPNTNDFIKEVTHTGGLVAKTSYSENLNIKLPINISGTKYLYAIADANNSINELNNTENAEQNIVFQQLEIELAPYADLAVSNVTAPELTIGDPATVTIGWTVTNVGTGIGKTSTWVDRIIASLDSTIGNSDDIILANFTHDGFLEKDKGYTRSEKLRLSPGFQGKYQLFVQTDATSQVFENSLETNNKASADNSFSVVRTPYADLLVSEVQAQPAASSGQPMQISWKVTNSGIGITDTSSWTDRVLLASDPEGKNIIANLGNFEHVGALAVGKTYNTSVDVTLPNGLSGNYYLVVTTGGPFEFIYTDNNSRTSNAVQVTFTPPPDLAVTNVTSPTSVQSGNKIDVSWTVANSGTGDAVASWTDQVFLREVGKPNAQLISLGSFTYNNGLQAGKDYTRSEQFVLPSTMQGLYEVVVKTNTTNSLYENSVTANNTNSTNPNNLLVSLTPRPDLQVKEIIAPTTVNAGGTISLDFIISNEGTVSTNKPNWQDRVYLSLDDKVSYDDLSLGS
ncbi:cadherin domain-containing protein [Nostoc sp. ChiQUE01b]|uniref:cadherin domain-containing protein n=1 Tax=Nostoc sp. ChiQUE01b TaxID=3075376 RepID=UPI002AD31B7D|nr:cadherin domain-containing protein [Nostoc sp. ChiQUE01b]MDZ8264642.1 CARDB domain-containing protein [Nostoc sp. ChiQUE01b]